MTPEKIDARLRDLLDPALRVGDEVHRPGLPKTWTTIEQIDGDQALVQVFHERAEEQLWTPLAGLTFGTGTPHLSRRPGYPHCLDPDCTLVLHDRDVPVPTTSLTGWPTQQERARQSNWRWVEACPEHRLLAEAYIFDWVGADGIVVRDRDKGRPVRVYPRNRAGQDLTLATTVHDVEQEDLFAATGTAL